MSDICVVGSDNARENQAKIFLKLVPRPREVTYLLSIGRESAFGHRFRWPFSRLRLDHFEDRDLCPRTVIMDHNEGRCLSLFREAENWRFPSAGPCRQTAQA